MCRSCPKQKKQLMCSGLASTVWFPVFPGPLELALRVSWQVVDFPHGGQQVRGLSSKARPWEGDVERDGPSTRKTKQIHGLASPHLQSSV